jgi:hypothetical protein
MGLMIKNMYFFLEVIYVISKKLRVCSYLQISMQQWRTILNLSRRTILNLELWVHVASFMALA